MKTLLKISTLSSMLVIALFVSRPQQVSAHGKSSNPVIKTELDLSLLKAYLLVEEAEEPRTLVFYDTKDNVVYTTILEPEATPDKNLIKYLNESDYLAENANTSYFRMK